MNPTIIEARIKTLEERLREAKFYYENSSWESGPKHRREIEQIEGDIRNLKSILKSPSRAADGEAPAITGTPPGVAGATMTIEEAEQTLFRPDTDDETLLAACRIVDQHTKHATCRDIATRIIAQFEERIIEV